MAKNYAVTLYFNTGYDKGNIPSNPSVLSNFETATFDAVFEWQNQWNAMIRVRGTWDTAKKADYLRLGSGTDAAYYVIDHVAMRANETAELLLTMDPLNTAGGLSAITVIGGWEQRSHVADDTLFANNIAEPWTPSQPMIIRKKEVIHTQEGVISIPHEIIITTCNLDKAKEYEAYVATASDEAGNTGQVVFPKIPNMPKGAGFGTTVTFPKGPNEYGNIFGDHQYGLPHMYAFDMGHGDDTLSEQVNALRSCGIESAIVNAYVIPGFEVELHYTKDTASPHYVYKMEGKTYDYTPEMPYKYASVKNNKALALYNKYSIASPSSGNSDEFEAAELAIGGGTAPTWRTKADPAPNGTVYAQPEKFDGMPTQYLEHAVAGMPWLAAGIAYSSASGSTITMANASRAQRSADMTMAANRGRFDLDTAKIQSDRNYANVGRTFNLLGNITGLVNTDSKGNKSIGSPGGIAGSVMDIAQAPVQNAYQDVQRDITRAEMERSYQMAMGDRIFGANEAAYNVAPTLAFPVSVNLSSYIGNVFVVWQTTLSDNDLARFDRFLTMYGYAVDRKLDKADLQNRTKFNYVKTSEAQIKSQYASRSVCEMIAEMFNNGVRLWHVAPSASAYDNNPVRS